MLYDNSEQIEVRHVISLEYHDVSVYGGGEQIAEGELWLKRNAIRLSRKRLSAGDMGVASLPFYLFSENQSEKEDFYFALLKNQQKIPGMPNAIPDPLKFVTKDIIKLVQTLHSSQEHLQTRWLNALLGRLFLALYKTPEAEAFFRKKIVKKISRVKKPDFITKLVLRRVDIGDSAPCILNPRLRDLTVDGETMVEADIKYSGNFRLEIAATARIDLGQRFKAREIDMVLAVVARKIEGHVLLRVKPPPSNRLWISFETMPNVEMTIEPIVSTRQITYGIILRQIESRIREVIAETIVLPFWDDMPFLETEEQDFRGGIWKRERTEVNHEEIKDEDAEDEAEAGPGEPSSLTVSDERTMSLPTIPAAPQTSKLRNNKSTKSPGVDDKASASTTAVDRTAVQPPRAMRSNSFASPANPKVTTDSAGADSPRRESISILKKDAAAAMKELSDRSLSTSPADGPADSLLNEKMGAAPGERKGSGSSKGSVSAGSTPRTGSILSGFTNGSQVSLGSTVATTADTDSVTTSKRTKTLASLTGSISGSEKGQQSLASLTAATAAAKKWGLGMVGRGDGRGKEDDRPGTPRSPMGRGRPLPPPGQPLPPPERGILSSLPTLPRRKPIPPRLPDRPAPNSGSNTPAPTEKPSLPERRRQLSINHVQNEGSEDVLVVEAPADSAPASPVGDGQEGFFGDLEEHKEASVPHEQKKLERPPLPPRATSDSPVEASDEKAVTEDAERSNPWKGEEG